MRKCNRIIGAVLAALVFTVISAYADTIVGGQVSGTWTTGGSPYIVVADLDIPYGQTLTIDPGVQVRFTGQFRMVAHGTLTAIGTQTDSIKFSRQLPYPTYTWRGIFFDRAQGTSEIGFCIIEWGYAQGSVGQTQAKGGGIHVLNATVNIQNSRISNCVADVKGAGIYLNSATSEISDNLIVSNFCNGDGGGILAEYCTTLNFHDNTITHNTADNGGGIQYISTGGVIESNVITYNTANPYYGGGLYIGGSSPVIRYNVINHNSSSTTEGTGIYCMSYASPQILFNEICWNNYTGIYCGNHSNPLIQNCTIYGNNSYAIRTSQYSIPTGLNNIIYGNSYTFYIPFGCSISMSYSDIQTAWAGTGNINTQPHFVNTYNDDFHLLPISPCIDAGSPSSPLDPDGTRADMGAHYFDQNQPQGTCSIALTPTGAPIVLPPQGGMVNFAVMIQNSPDYFNLFDAWIKLTQPDSQILPLANRPDLYLSPGRQTTRLVGLNISASSMPGTYTITGYVGDNPNIIEDFDSFTFVKQGAGSIGSEPGWMTYDDGEIVETIYLKSALPQETQLLGHFPEPFNPTATIRFTLPEPCRVTLTVYDVQGRVVSSKPDLSRQAGLQEIVFDGSNLPSGIYLYRLEAGQYKASGKMVLLK
ncbi:MAG: right-handed parallel beta-helix repeat-containing protein [bacterium]|nr:right-handed parallel beta-helix repeat-containing protein [bacterium]